MIGAAGIGETRAGTSLCVGGEIRRWSTIGGGCCCISIEVVTGGCAAKASSSETELAEKSFTGGIQ